MTDLASQSDDAAARRLLFVLQQLDSLPTLSSIATRLLDLTADDESSVQEIISLVGADPALASRVLKLCQCHPRGRASGSTSLERAVLMLGLDALRAAVLSVQVFQMFEQVAADETDSPSEHTFDRVAFWHHSLAVAVLSEAIVEVGGRTHTIEPGEAFLAGLLHDLGMLALHAALPEQFDRIVHSAERAASSSDQACLHVLGVDTHTAGKRLAEQWGLPEHLSQVIWLSGHPPAGVPDDAHRSLILVVSLADALARRWYVAPAGHGMQGEPVEVFAESLGIDDAALQEAVGQLDHRVQEQAEALGLDGPDSAAILLQSVCRANAALGRLSLRVREQAEVVQGQKRSLAALESFLRQEMPGASVLAVLGRIAESAAHIDGLTLAGVLYHPAVSEPWQLLEYGSSGQPLRQQFIADDDAAGLPDQLTPLREADEHLVCPAPELASRLGLGGAAGLHGVRLCCAGEGRVIVMFRGGQAGQRWQTLLPLIRAWQRELLSASQREQASQTGEELAIANRALAETRAELARTEAQAAVGEIAAGAAHEMNNPLTIISGRSQVLVARLEDAELRRMAAQIVEQSHRLSDMITSLRLFAHPPEPNLRPTDLRDLIGRAAQMLRDRVGDGMALEVVVPQELSVVNVDPEQMGRAISELLLNAAESPGCRHIALLVQIGPGVDRWTVQVTDDGRGLSSTALTHAFDPFFSEKAAGRQPGLGLAQARRIVEAHGGTIRLENVAPQGARASITLPTAAADVQRREVA